jgi:hypothetical protein
MTVYRRLTLRRADGRTYLRRWALTVDRIGSIKLHRMDAPDPGEDLHDHPWTFWSLVLWGGYDEERAPIREACAWADIDQLMPPRRPGVEYHGMRGNEESRRWLSLRALRLDECHRIVRLHRSPTWTLVVCGPGRRWWGFYPPGGYMPAPAYDHTASKQRHAFADGTWDTKA